MNISLIYPLLSRRRASIDENKQFWPPLGLAYIAAVLEKNGHKVQIIDRDLLLRKNEMDFDRADSAALNAIRDFGTAMVGISATTPNMPDVTGFARRIKEECGDIGIVIGGPHPSGEPVLSMEEIGHVDAVAVGEGEFTMLDLANRVPFGKVAGLVYRDGGDIISNAARPPIEDIDGLPMPARHLLDMEFYARPSRFTSRNLNLRTTSIFTARGCPYRCNFCAGPLVFSGKVRFHSPDRVVDEIEELVSGYHVEALYFAEDMFLSSRKRAEDILNLFISRGVSRKIKWMAQAKANIVTKELLGLMKEAGCVGVEYGFESGSQRMLDLMNKNLKVEESLRAADITRRARMRFQANIIVGYPGEREDDFRKTVDFIKKVRPNMVGFNIFMPLPGTPSYRRLKGEGKDIPRWEDIGDPEAPHVNFADMPKDVFERLYLEARLKVILPVNLRNFVKDNIHDPLRLIRVAATQFNGVLVKTAKSALRLASLGAGRKRNTGKTKVLFISYNGLLEPIMPSQGVPYLAGLARNGYDFTLLTYEKKRDLKEKGRDGIAAMRRDLAALGIEWLYLAYHKNPPLLSTIFDLSVGCLRVLYIILSRRVKIVHLRGITPGMMMLPLSRVTDVRTVFDMRGFLAEEYVGGGIWKEGDVSFRIVKKAERRLLKTADAVTVLTRKHLDINRASEWLSGRRIPMDVVPCCVDTSRFTIDDTSAAELRSRHGLNDNFVLMYPGKIGTFYFMKEMLDFYKALMAAEPGAVFLIVTRDDGGPVFKAAEEAGIGGDRVRIIKGPDYSRMPEYYRMADAGIFFINPYKKMGSSPIKMGEFLASGVPVIINPGVGDTEELVRDNGVGVVVEHFKEDDYIKGAREILALKGEGAALRSRCRDAALRHLSLESGVVKYSDIYEAVMSNR